jgi:hypothetical protein
MKNTEAVAFQRGKVIALQLKDKKDVTLSKERVYNTAQTMTFCSV